MIKRSQDFLCIRSMDSEGTSGHLVQPPALNRVSYELRTLSSLFLETFHNLSKQPQAAIAWVCSVCMV